MPEQTYKTMVDFLCGRIDNVPRKENCEEKNSKLGMVIWCSQFLDSFGLDVFYGIIVTRPSITDEVTDKNIQQLFTFVKNGAYEAAKLHTAIYRRITPTNQCLSFFGAEYECIIKNFVAPFMEHIVESACNSPHCSMKQSRACFNTFPSATVKSSFVHDVQKWFLEATTSVCGKKVNQNISDEFSFVDENITTGIKNRYCNGNRKYKARFFKKLPQLLVVDVAGDIDPIDMATIPEQLHIRFSTNQGNRYYRGQKIS
ncbi:uncharacterized protein LOC130653669 [Hydractinia symbiolongicarpus]|uniref:uncharacterized protein LOC130653669 n=1 Tax=Hydractinia symbiolongicarpus TaxID=13093 RepID=UPI002550A1B3|nr:uncharacterized protein LOC130653669 [Hydractinia symbiolongicarpus]